MAKIKVQISIDENLLNRIDAYSDDNFMTRSGFITMASTQVLDADEIRKNVRSVAKSLRTIADNGYVTPEQLANLEEYERMISVLGM